MKISISKSQVIINGRRATRIDRGSGRRVYRCGKVVVKLNDELRQSSNELRKWRDVIEDKDKKFFVPPLCGQIRGNGWIAVPRIKFRRGRYPSWAHDLAYRLAIKYGLELYTHHDDDMPAMNWCVDVRGRFWIYDYGYYKTNGSSCTADARRKPADRRAPAQMTHHPIRQKGDSHGYEVSADDLHLLRGRRNEK